MPRKGGGNIINWISNWASGIIIAVVIGTIIEMLLPEGNSKKYIKVVIGVYVLFTIVSPVITKFTGKEIEVSNVLDLSQYVEEAEESNKVQNTIKSDNENNIKSIYLDGIKNDMREKIKSKGYNVTSIDVDISNNDDYKILGVSLEIMKLEDDNTTKDNIKQNEIETIETVNKVEINIGGEENKIEGDSNKKVRNGKSNLSYSEKKELKEYLSSVYEIDEDDIKIK